VGQTPSEIVQDGLMCRFATFFQNINSLTWMLSSERFDGRRGCLGPNLPPPVRPRGSCSTIHLDQTMALRDAESEEANRKRPGKRVLDTSGGGRG
jgi:hypothetical protein